MLIPCIYFRIRHSSLSAQPGVWKWSGLDLALSIVQVLRLKLSQGARKIAMVKPVPVEDVSARIYSYASGRPPN